MCSNEYLNEILGNVTRDCELTDWSFKQRQFSTIGQNYFGTLIPVTLFGKHQERYIEYDLVIKVAPSDERYRVSGALTQFFIREIFVYSRLLNKYVEFLQNVPENLRFVVPRCYYLSNIYCREVIVMQDMCSSGYQPFKNAFMDLNHTVLTLKSLARFHALSFLLKERDPKLYDEAKKNCLPLSENTNQRFMLILKDRLNKASEKLQNTKYSHLLKELTNKCGYLIESAATTVSETCICHGDLWKENVLFQYEDNMPRFACLIDYQTARMCSPSFDVLFLIASSTDKNLRQHHFRELLDIYYSTFAAFLKEAGLDSETIYSRKAFENDLKIVGAPCFIVANTALWLSNGLQEEGHVKSKLVYSTPEEKEYAVNKYRTIIVNILDDFSSSGFLNM